MIIDLTLDELKQLEYELRYREGELMVSGDFQQASKLASIADKIFRSKNGKDN